MVIVLFVQALVKTFPESKAERVLGYVQGMMDDEAPALPVTEEEHKAWCERLRKLVESQPMTEGDTVARMPKRFLSPSNLSEQEDKSLGLQQCAKPDIPAPTITVDNGLTL